MQSYESVSSQHAELVKQPGPGYYIGSVWVIQCTTSTDILFNSRRDGRSAISPSFGVGTTRTSPVFLEMEGKPKISTIGSVRFDLLRRRRSERRGSERRLAAAEERSRRGWLVR